MYLHSEHDLLPYVRAFLRERPRWQSLAKTHHWKALAAQIKPSLDSAKIRLPRKLAAWLEKQQDELEDATAPSAADVPFVFHDYCVNKNRNFIAALEKCLWTEAARIASQHRLLADRVPFPEIYNFLVKFGKDKCAQYNIPVSLAPGRGQAQAHRTSISTDELLRPLAKAMGIHDPAVYPQRCSLHDAATERLQQQVGGGHS